MKTSSAEAGLNPFITIVIGKILDYVLENADEVVEAIRDQIGCKDDPEVKDTMSEFSYDPSPDNLLKLHNLLEKKGEDPEKLASLLVSKTVV